MKTILFSIFIFFSASAFSQNAFVKGKVNDVNNKPVPYASIELKANNKTVKSTVTGADGLFILSNLSNGNYKLEISSVGYAKQLKEITVDNLHQQLELPIFELIPDQNILKDITVVVKKKFVEVKADKTILNIENNIMASGSSTFDMIKKGPAVSADKDDNLKLKGSVAQIFIDGKPAYLSGQQLTDYLKNLPADAVSRIEIISNPGSKYEAAGTSGIINIKLKKSAAHGLNGTANIGAGVGRYPKFNSGTTFNYRKNNVNIFGALNIGVYESFNQLDLVNIFGTGDQKIYQERDNYWHPVTKVSSFRTGIDYSISEKSTFGFLIRGNLSNENAPTDNHTVFMDQNKTPISFINTFKDDKGRTTNTSYNLNFKTSFDSIGSELNIDADYVHYQSNRKDINYNYFLGNNKDTLRDAYIFRNSKPANVDILSFKTDYTKYFGSSLKIETGLKTSFVTTDNNLIVDSVKNFEWKSNLNLSNHFVYKENINAVYVSASKEWKKWNVQAGLRTEQTNYTSNSVTMGQKINKSYWNLFPSFFTSYKMNDDHTFNFSFTRRINRPSYQSLNPFLSYVDPYTIFKGNPYLQPSIGNSFEVKHNFKQFLFTSLSYTHRNNATDEVIRQDEVSKIATRMSENVGYSNYVSLNITVAVPITKWWMTETNINGYLSNSVSTFKVYEYNTSNVSAYFSHDQTFTLPNNYRIQGSIYYNAPSKDGFTKTRSSTGGNFGVQKQIWERKAALRFSVTNIGMNEYRAQVKNDQLDITWRNQWEGPRFNLNFSWKFGNANVKASRNRKTASGDESNRVNL